jgi:hypothetical protein
MKIIEALKETKELQRKAEDLRKKVAQHSAHLNYETPVYPDQKKQVREWIQAHSDIVKKILELRIAIQRTNLVTPVTIEVGGKAVTKTIAEWIHRRRDLADEELAMWKSLTDKNLKEGTAKQSNEQTIEVKIVRCYDPEERDNKMDIYSSEPTTVDAKLEIVNAVTDLID